MGKAAPALNLSRPAGTTQGAEHLPSAPVAVGGAGGQGTLPAAPLMVPVPVAMPPAAELRELVFAAARAEAARLLAWLTYDDAAAHLRCGKRSVQRLPERLGLPVAEVGGMRLIARADLDALLVAHMTAPAGSVLLVWPSSLAVPPEGRVVEWPTAKLRAELAELAPVVAERRAA